MQQTREHEREAETRHPHNRTLYIFTAYFGDPYKPVPSKIKVLKKRKLAELMEENGFQMSAISGDKNSLLRKIQTEIPRVTFVIDSAECLHRLIAIPLGYWKWDDSHSYHVIMPKRGECLNGCMRLGERRPEISLFPRFLDELTIRSVIESSIIGSASSSGASGSIRDDFVKFRVLSGSAASPMPVLNSCTSQLHSCFGGWIPIEKFCLQENDNIQFVYDSVNSVYITLRLNQIKVSQSLIARRAVGCLVFEHFALYRILSHGGARPPIHYVSGRGATGVAGGGGGAAGGGGGGGGELSKSSDFLTDLLRDVSNSSFSDFERRIQV